MSTSTLHRRHPMKACLVAALVALLSVLTACGGGSGGTASSGDSGGPGDSAAADARVKMLYAGTNAGPPSTSPAPVPGKTIWIISFSESYSASSNTAAGAKAGAEAMGWGANVYDAKGDPSKAIDGIRAAVAAGADAIYSIYWDCSAIKSGLLEAKAAGVVRIAQDSADCDGEPLFDYTNRYETGVYDFNKGDWLTWAAGWQAVATDYVISKTQGHAKTVYFQETDGGVFDSEASGFREAFATCSTCTIVETVEFTAADFGPNLQEKAQQAFLKHPDVNSIVVSADAVLTSGVIAALKASGKYGSVVIGGGEGSAATVPLMREYKGDWGFTSADVRWEGWAGVDAANRILAGEQPAQSMGLGYQLVDRDHNLPSGDDLLPVKDGKPVDYAAMYKQAWGVS
jgi:ribose transport system substrate-binding protein